MDGKNTFIEMEMEDMYCPVVEKVKKLTKKIDKQFKDYNIRGFTIERKKENIYYYMKNLAFKKFRKKHLIQIYKKNYIDIFSKKELNKITRPKSHRNPYHKKTYLTIIYRNLYNYKYRPYLMPLTNEDKSNKLFLNLTDIKKKRKKIKRKIIINYHLEMKLKNLTKINERLKEKQKTKIIEKIKLLPKRNSNPSLKYNLSCNQYLINNWNNQRKRIQGKIPKLRSEKTMFYNMNSYSSKHEESTTNYRSILEKSEMKKGKRLILPKIKEELVTTIKNLNQINNKIRSLKTNNKENKPKEEINDNNLLNLNLQQLYKLFYLKQKKKNQKLKKIKINTKEQSKNKDLTNKQNDDNNNTTEQKKSQIVI